MTRWCCHILTLVLALSLIGVPSASAADPCRDTDVFCPAPVAKADQAKGAIVTTGVNFPNLDLGTELGRATKRHAACPDCEWSVVPSCMAADAESFDVACLGATQACSRPGDLRFRVYMRRGAGPWEVQGSVCLGPGERPATVSDIGEAVRVEVAKYLPDADPSFQPAAGGIVNLPTVFAAGEPRAITESFEVLGFTVVVKARARWQWAFEQGVTRGFASPGGAYPDVSVSHTYDRPGTRQVVVTTFWRGEFTLNGDGPFPVPGPELSKTSAALVVPVREARAELVAE